MKKIIKRFVAVLVVMTVFSTMFVSGVFASATTSIVDGDTTIAMASVVPSTTGQQTNATKLTELTTTPTYSNGEFTTTANYQYFEFKVNVRKAGLYTLYLNAKANDSGERAFLYVDGERCKYFGDKPYSNSVYGITLSNTQSVEIPAGSCYLNAGEHTVRLTSQTPSVLNLSDIRFEYNTYLSNMAESAVTLTSNGEKVEIAYMSEDRGFAMGGIKLSKLTKDVSYVEVLFNAPITGKYQLDFLALSDNSTSRNTVVRATVDNEIVNDNLAITGESQKSSLKIYNVANSIDLTAGEHKLKLLAITVPHATYSIIPITTVKLTYIPKTNVEVVNAPALFGEAPVPTTQTFCPKDISGITFTGASDNTIGYVKTDANGNIDSYATKTIQSGVTYYKDADGNYAFSAKHDGDTKGCINIPIDVTAAGNYDVTVNYYISPVGTYTSKSAWLVKANDQILAYTNAHGTNGASNTDKMELEAGSADFSQGKNTISFELSSLETFARRIIIESIVLTPNSDRAFYVNPDSITVNSKSDIISKSTEYNGASTAPYVVTKFETTSAPTPSETYIEFTLNAPFDGNYTIAFDKVGAVSKTYTGGMWNVSVNNGTATLVDFTRNYKSKDTVSINSALNEGINTLKFVYDSTGKAKQDYGFFLTGITVTPDAADIPEIADIVISTMPEAGTYQARATIKNDTSKDETAVIIAAVYGMENNKVDLKNIDYMEYLVKVGETKEISTPVIVPDGITEGWIKLFVWTDIDNKITPIIRSTTIE